MIVCHTMRVGVVFPQVEIGRDTGAIREYANAVADLGFDHLLMYDHVLGANPDGHAPWTGNYNFTHTFHDAFVLLGYLAAVEPRLEYATSTITAPQRQTALLAKQAAALDVLTQGRFRLGVGLGWNDVEYEALGMEWKGRGARLEEQIEVMRLLWANESVTFRGRWHTINAAGINPLPERRSIPIWIGAMSETAVSRAARLADGLLIWPRRDQLADPATVIAEVRERVRAAGRDPLQFGFEGQLAVVHLGTPDAWARDADTWRTAGATHIAVNTVGERLDAAGHIAQLTAVADTLGLNR